MYIVEKSIGTIFLRNVVLFNFICECDKQIKSCFQIVFDSPYFKYLLNTNSKNNDKIIHGAYQKLCFTYSTSRNVF